MTTRIRHLVPPAPAIGSVMTGTPPATEPEPAKGAEGVRVRQLHRGERRIGSATVGLPPFRPTPPPPPEPAEECIYTHATFGDLKRGLAARLDDADRIFFTDREITLYLQEAFRTFGLLTGFWRDRFVFETVPGIASYAIPERAPGLLDYTVSDMNMIEVLQYQLLETQAAERSQSHWHGTEMFTLDDLTQSLERRRNQFLSDTGMVLSRDLVDIRPDVIGRTCLDEDVIDVRRVAFLGAEPFDYFTHLRREDENAMTHFDQPWIVSRDTPAAWSIMAPPPLELQLAPPPIATGELDMVTVKSGARFRPSHGRPTALGIPDDCSWIIKWGALADLMGKDGVCRDPVRAQFAEEAYGHGVLVARLLPVIIGAEINGVSLSPTTLDELDSAVADWQNQHGEPTDVAVQGSNLVWIYPVPDDVYSITLDVVGKAKLPEHDHDPIQIGREQVDMIIDYAEHLAMFKCAGAEWHATSTNAANFVTQCVTYNRRLSASARYLIEAKQRSIKEKFSRPRRIEAEGIGALPSGQTQQQQSG